MGRKIIKVPSWWKHPKDSEGHIPMYEHFPYDEEEVQEGLREGWLKDDPPNYGCDVMPEWMDLERTHIQMYEDTSEGTPISPVMETSEALARWLVDNKASAFGSMTATYEQWLATIKAGYVVGGVYSSETGLISGVEFEGRKGESVAE